MHRRPSLGWVVLVLAGMLLPGRGLADEVKPLPPDEKAFGLTLTEWAVAWWQWSYSLPVSGHPSDDTTGVRAGVGQRLPVWFLPSRPAGTTRNRTIYVPAGYAILFAGPALLGWETPGARSDEALIADLESTAQRWRDTIHVFEVSVDGVSLPDLQRYYVQSPIFTVVLPPGNVLNEPVTAGKDHRMAGYGVGYFYLLPSLSVGKHVIQVKTEGVNMFDNNKPTKGMSVHNLIIEEPNEPTE
jgi:hypothetical protein